MSLGKRTIASTHAVNVVKHGGHESVKALCLWQLVDYGGGARVSLVGCTIVLRLLKSTN